MSRDQFTAGRPIAQAGGGGQVGQTQLPTPGPGAVPTGGGGTVPAQGGTTMQPGTVSDSGSADPGRNTGIVPPSVPGSTPPPAGTPGMPMGNPFSNGGPSMGQMSNGGFAGQGYGQIDYSRYMPQTASNPYLSGQADDLQRRATEMMNTGIRSARGDGIMAGGFGGSGQALETGTAIKGATDVLSGNLANLYGGAYNQDATRGLQQYQGDQSYSLGVGGLGNQAYSNMTGRMGTMGGLQNQAYANDTGRIGTVGGLQNQQLGLNQNYNLGLGGLQNQRYGMDQGFYTAQRGQDLQQIGLGAGLQQQGLNMDWMPLNQANGIYGNYTGFGNTTQGGIVGGGTLGALGGALGTAQLGANLGLWGNNTNTRSNGWW